MYRSDRKWRLQYVKKQIEDCLESYKFMVNNESNRNKLKNDVEEIIHENLYTITDNYPEVKIETDLDDPTKIHVFPVDEYTEKLIQEIYNS